MDVELYFLKEVIEKYKIDRILKPLNVGDGELQNVSLSDLRKELDFCYYEISHSVTFKEKLLDYLEDYLVDLRALRISEQKTIIRKLKKKIIKAKKKQSNKKDNEYPIEHLDKLTWKTDQETYILHYLKEQKYFIRDWLSEKRKEDKNQLLKNFINKTEKKELIKDLKKVKKIKQYKWHSLIEPLVSGKISGIQKNTNQYLNKTDLSKKVIYTLNLDLKVGDIAPYIYYSFIENKEDTKNLFSENKVKAIYEYCMKNNIEITDDVFLSKIKQYIN
ncbi:hypothetical protein [Tenacibaculum mesophilum]|uniref:hypothetical protein n=1 Tax=Tenacibaculum mesophilum TaxID=104268 RepID=UPI0024928085|nr:hypothetical protein [Tenacibaculum mesophilum]